MPMVMVIGQTDVLPTYHIARPDGQVSLQKKIVFSNLFFSRNNEANKPEKYLNNARFNFSMCREEKSAYGPLVAAIKLILGFQTLLAIKLALCCVLSLTSCCQNCTDTGLAIGLLLKNNPNIHWFRGLVVKVQQNFGTS